MQEVAGSSPAATTINSLGIPPPNSSPQHVRLQDLTPAAKSFHVVVCLRFSYGHVTPKSSKTSALALMAARPSHRHLIAASFWSARTLLSGKENLDG